MARNYRVNQVRESALDRLLNQTIPQHLSDKRNDEKYKEEISYRRERDANADTLALEERDYRRGQEELRLDKVARQDGLTLGSSFAAAAATFYTNGDFESADLNNEKLITIVENNPHITMSDFATIEPSKIAEGLKSKVLLTSGTEVLSGDMSSMTTEVIQENYEDGLSNRKYMIPAHRKKFDTKWADASQNDINLEFVTSAGKSPAQILLVNTGFDTFKETVGMANLDSTSTKDVLATAKGMNYEIYLKKQKESGESNILGSLDEDSAWLDTSQSEKDKLMVDVYYNKYGQRDMDAAKNAISTFVQHFNRPDEVRDYYKSSENEDRKIELYNDVRQSAHFGLAIPEGEELDKKMRFYGFPESYISGASQKKQAEETGGGGSEDLNKVIPLNSDQVARVNENIVTIKKNVSKDNFKESLTNAKSSLLEQDPNMEQHNPLIHKIKFDKDGPYVLGKDIDLDRYNTKSLATPNIYDLRLRNYQKQVDTGRDSDGFKLTSKQIEKAKNAVKKLQNKAPQFTQMSSSVNSIDNPLSIHSPEYEKVLKELNVKNRSGIVSISPESPFYEMLASENQKKRGRKLSVYINDVVQKILRSRGDEKYRVTSRFLNELGLN